MNDNSKVIASTIALKALETAKTQVGQEELPRGSNKGRMINEYLRAVGLNPGYAWCQAFVYWCYNEAAAEMNMANPAIKTAGVYDCWNRTKQPSATKLLKKDVMLMPQTVLPGDQFIMTFGRGAGHTGIVEGVTHTGDAANPIILHTIEGNSNADGSREGYAVVRRTRNITERAIQGFIRYN